MKPRRRRTTAKQQTALERAIAQRDELTRRLARYEPEAVSLAIGDAVHPGFAPLSVTMEPGSPPCGGVCGSSLPAPKDDPSPPSELPPAESLAVDAVEDETTRALRDELAEERANGEREHQRAEAIATECDAAILDRDSHQRAEADLAAQLDAVRKDRDRIASELEAQKLKEAARVDEATAHGHQAAEMTREMLSQQAAVAELRLRVEAETQRANKSEETRDEFVDTLLQIHGALGMSDDDQRPFEEVIKVVLDELAGARAELERLKAEKADHDHDAAVENAALTEGLGRRSIELQHAIAEVESLKDTLRHVSADRDRAHARHGESASVLQKIREIVQGPKQ